ADPDCKSMPRMRGMSGLAISLPVLAGPAAAVFLWQGWRQLRPATATIGRWCLVRWRSLRPVPYACAVFGLACRQRFAGREIERVVSAWLRSSGLAGGSPTGLSATGAWVRTVASDAYQRNRTRPVPTQGFTRFGSIPLQAAASEQAPVGASPFAAEPESTQTCRIYRVMLYE